MKTILIIQNVFNLNIKMTSYIICNFISYWNYTNNTLL